MALFSESWFAASFTLRESLCNALWGSHIAVARDMNPSKLIECLGETLRDLQGSSVLSIYDMISLDSADPHSVLSPSI